MPPNDIMGVCSECTKEKPTHELTQIREGGEIMLLCSSCRTKHCKHPEKARGKTPQGRPKCNLCKKVLKAQNSEQDTQTTLGGFSA